MSLLDVLGVSCLCLIGIVAAEALLDAVDVERAWRRWQLRMAVKRDKFRLYDEVHADSWEGKRK